MPATPTSGTGAATASDHRIPLGGKRGREGGADAAAGAGDQGYPSGPTGHARQRTATATADPQPVGTVVPRLDAMRATVTRTLRAVRLVIRDGRIPRPLRWAGALGLLPVPGPFDEIVLLAVAGVLWLGYRDQLREAWQKAAAS